MRWGRTRGGEGLFTYFLPTSNCFDEVFSPKPAKTAQKPALKASMCN